eukprot:gb/GECG01015012.1/.p1 GENE.gb/GECG01015012.1/~~gb/GECG01015012.1/.p1  ORF type:complete len:480 (+),score=51.43 gb/GECG01015012.1/:1-1440(+)
MRPLKCITFSLERKSAPLWSIKVRGNERSPSLAILPCIITRVLRYDTFTDEVHALEFFGATNALSGSKDGTICIWRCHDWLCLHTVRGEHKGVVNDIAVHNSGRLALSVSGDRSLILWDLTKGRPAYKTKLSQIPKRVIWSPHCEIFVVQFDKSVQVYAADTGKAVKSLCVSSKIRDSVFLSDRMLVLGCEDCAFRVCDLELGSILRVVKTGHRKRIRNIGLIDNPPPQNTEQTKTYRPVFDYDAVSSALGKKRELEGIGIGNADRYIVSVDSDGIVALWDALHFLREDENSAIMNLKKLKEHPVEQAVTTDEFGNALVVEPTAEGLQPICTLLSAADSRVTALATSLIIPQHIESKKQAAKEASNAAKKRKAAKEEEPTPVVNGKKSTKQSKKQKTAPMANNSAKAATPKANSKEAEKGNEKPQHEKPSSRGVAKDGVVSFVDSRQLSKLRQGQKRKQKKRPKKVFASYRSKQLQGKT